MDFSHIMDAILKYAVAPVGAFIWWMFKKYDLRIEVIEARMNVTEKENAVLNTKHDNLKEDIVEIKATLNALLVLCQKRSDI